jgi:hypothetical protein
VSLLRWVMSISVMGEPFTRTATCALTVLGALSSAHAANVAASKANLRRR